MYPDTKYKLVDRSYFVTCIIHSEVLLRFRSHEVG